MKHPGFNPKARWDRHIPQEENSGSGILGEKIDCLVFFSSGKIYPRVFTWNNKEYEIKKVTYNWQERRGGELLNFFSVDTGADLYQICFNNTSCSWKLDKIIN